MNRIEQLKQSADRIMKNRPSYQGILGFYSEVFQAQEKSKENIELSPILIDENLLTIKQKNEMPLIDPSEFCIDPAASIQLLDKICDLAIHLAPNLAGCARNIKTALQNEEFDAGMITSAVIENNESSMVEMVDYLDITKEELVLFGYLCMAPSIHACSQQLEAYLKDRKEHMHGYCPVCGSTPDLAFLDEKGKRHLKCSFCFHEWVTKRMGCVFCQNTDPETQHYFFSNEEKEYRVSLCDNCNKYMKVVDLRQINRFFHPGLELISTLHLDMKAREKGYMSKEP